MIDNDDNNIIDLSEEDIEIINYDEFETAIHNEKSITDMLLRGSNRSLKQIEKMLYSSQSFLTAIKSMIPEISYKAILSPLQKEQLANGALKLMARKDGSLTANLIDPKTHKIIEGISLEKVVTSPEIANAITNFSTQMQLIQLADQIQSIQSSVEEVRQGQEYDRLSTAYSCQQKLLQVMNIQNHNLRQQALLNLALASEDSRNLLMQSQSANLDFLMNQPEDYVGKIMNGSNSKKINSRISDIRESLNALNMVSLVEAISYQELGESLSSNISLQYFADYINKTYIENSKILEKLDLLDPLPNNSWSKNLISIKERIKKLSDSNILLIEGGKNESKNNRQSETM